MLSNNFINSKDDMEMINGYVDSIVYRNADNGYTVLKLSNDGEQATCVGCFHYIGEGEYIEAYGSYTEHYTYGQQFNVDSYEVKTPKDVVSIERYLGSGAIKGIGPALAKRIVKGFKEDTIRIIEEEPECLAQVKGISEHKAQEIAQQFQQKIGLRQAMMFLQHYGISINLAARIYEKYNDRIYKIIEENPYKLAEDVEGIGFKTADEIASKVGIKTDSDFRLRGGLLYILSQGLGEGHTFLEYCELIDRAVQILTVDAKHIEKCIMDLAMDRKIIIKSIKGLKQVYISQYYYMELSVAAKLKDLNITYNIDDEDIEKRLSNIEEKSNIALDELQKHAVKESFRNGLLIITGGPGTGKTTTINTIIKCFEEEDMEISLAAPTGRAAKRMTEATGYDAKTIHRLLEIAPSNDTVIEKSGFGRNEDNPLETDVIIIDEMSMVDIVLMNALLKAIIPGTRLILVGDANQLPSVGPGSVLKDIINSNQFNVATLSKIFRQAQKSDIIVNAHKINNGQSIILDNKSEDFFFLKRYNADIIIRVILTLVQKKLPPYVETTPYNIQVLSPMRKGLLGVERLNTILQEYLNPRDIEKAEKENKKGLFREGDKVMQIKNNYQLEWEIIGNYNIPVEKGQGVFNGDTGIIKEINTFAQTMTVEYDENKIVEYTFKQTDELELAYAITIHKAQGTEYPAVVIPLLSGPRMLFNRNLLYTAVTRAKKCVTIVGDEKVFFNMADNISEKTRYTGLKDRICEIMSNSSAMQ